MRSRSAAAALLLLLPAAVSAAESNPESVLSQVLSDPESGYSARAVTIRWFGGQEHARSSEYTVWYMPPGRYRREHFAPDGSVDSVAVSDGSSEVISLTRKGRTLSGDSVKSSDKVLDPEQEERLLKQNYELSLTTTDSVAWRPAWLLTLSPKTQGKCRQTFTVDRETGVIVASRRYLPGGRIAALFKFTRFTPGPQPEDRFALPPVSTSAARSPGPEFMTIPELEKAANEKSYFPPELPGGFVFESAGLLHVGGEPVQHARYTDGLSVISVFQTRRRVKASPMTIMDDRASRSALRLSAAGRVLRVSTKGRYFTLVGDVSAPLLRDIGAALRRSAR